ncbi:MAG TPA: 30S ribosomal protein S8 [bacterium]|jgi:small subunit ribosomal protein S8|nr:30S ribosomal protein S8 [bacterium]HNT65350.1 30S ribosomal protein S8 [bacterium]HOX86518.1 30S ribosomal protein S8 [bacterium]HPG46544.1 30S ribosomal protein S8 [bacterium]HPM98400.1 30S ribosomal protein S8 [bacterium]
MSKTDPIADYLTRIRNATRAKHRKVDIPASNLKKQITRILQDENYIQNFVLIEDDKQSLIRIYLKYDQEEKSVISGIKRISKPGLRIYVGKNKIPRVYNNLGVSILTTSQGLMTGQEARRRGVGGEILCHIW